MLNICVRAHKMSVQFFVYFRLVLTGFVLSQIEAETMTFDYMVDCSACQFAPMTNIESYSCAVRCNAEGKCSVYFIIHPKSE